jgi:hypothetical protein
VSHRDTESTEAEPVLTTDCTDFTDGAGLRRFLTISGLNPDTLTGALRRISLITTPPRGSSHAAEPHRAGLRCNGPTWPFGLAPAAPGSTAFPLGIAEQDLRRDAQPGDEAADHGDAQWPGAREHLGDA